MLLEKLCSISGVTGDETVVRDFIASEIKEYCDDIKIDSLGNLIAYKRASSDKTIALFAHMDEVGVMITGITESGYLTFRPAGGIDPSVLPSKTVIIGKNQVPGVIGLKAIHLQGSDERKEKIAVDKLYIDIGAKDKSDAQKHIAIGDYAVFESDYLKFGDNLIKSKALDDRAGCAILIELLKGNYNVNIIGVFTVMEEIGLRGAKVAAFGLDCIPDFSLVIETTTASDVFGSKPHEFVARLGLGPAISILDRATYHDKGLVERIIAFAGENKILVQFKQGTFGGNDAGSIHLCKDGIRTLSISIPCRYIHSPVSVMAKADYENTYQLIKLFLEKGIK